MNNRLSVILPNYNHGQYLERSLTALCEQTRPPGELIIVDDASTDNSWEIIKGFAHWHPFVRAFRNDQNMGCAASVNRAIELSTGDLLYSAAADDYVEPTLFEKSLVLLHSYPHAGLCCTVLDRREVDSGLHWLVGRWMALQPTYLNPEWMVALARAGKLVLAGNTVVVRRDAFLEAGGFQPMARYACDWLVYSLVGFRHGICVVPEPLAVSFVHADGYCERTRNDPEAMFGIMYVLSRPEHAEPAERIRRSGALYIFGYPMLRFLLSNREAYGIYLNSSYLRRVLWYIFLYQFKHLVPATIGNAYLKVFG